MLLAAKILLWAGGVCIGTALIGGLVMAFLEGPWTFLVACMIAAFVCFIAACAIAEGA